MRRLALDLTGKLALERDDVVLALVGALLDENRQVREVAERHLRRLARPDA
jgi:hypothetical protein